MCLFYFGLYWDFVGLVALRHGWNQSQPGIELMSPALEGEFFSTGPSGKSLICTDKY